MILLVPNAYPPHPQPPFQDEGFGLPRTNTITSKDSKHTHTHTHTHTHLPGPSVSFFQSFFSNEKPESLSECQLSVGTQGSLFPI